jgi:hypothetical protein
MGSTASSLREGVSDIALKTIAQLSPENKKILDEEVDAYTILMVAALPPQLAAGKPLKDDFLKSEEVDLGWKKAWFSNEWEKDPPVADTVVIGNNHAKLKVLILSEDDLVGTASTFVLDVIRNPILLPMKDCFYFCPSDKEAENLMEDLKLLPKEGHANPVPYHTWDEMSSDEAMSRIFFYGIGSVLMHSQSSRAHDYHQELGPFVVDMDLSGYEVRPGFAKYGARIHFDSQQKLTAIFDYGAGKLVKPGEGVAWERAKHIAKQTTFALITSREHLMWTHMMLSNTMARIKIQELPPNHPIRRLLTVFTFRTNFVNKNAQFVLVSLTA